MEDDDLIIDLRVDQGALEQAAGRIRQLRDAMRVVGRSIGLSASQSAQSAQDFERYLRGLSEVINREVETVTIETVGITSAVAFAGVLQIDSDRFADFMCQVRDYGPVDIAIRRSQVFGYMNMYHGITVEFDTHRHCYVFIDSDRNDLVRVGSGDLDAYLRDPVITEPGEQSESLSVTQRICGFGDIELAEFLSCCNEANRLTTNREGFRRRLIVLLRDIHRINATPVHSQREYLLYSRRGDSTIIGYDAIEDLHVPVGSNTPITVDARIASLSQASGLDTETFMLHAAEALANNSSRWGFRLYLVDLIREHHNDAIIVDQNELCYYVDMPGEERARVAFGYLEELYIALENSEDRPEISSDDRYENFLNELLIALHRTNKRNTVVGIIAEARQSARHNRMDHFRRLCYDNLRLDSERNGLDAPYIFHQRSNRRDLRYVPVETLCFLLGITEQESRGIRSEPNNRRRRIKFSI